MSYLCLFATCKFADGRGRQTISQAGRYKQVDRQVVVHVAAVMILEPVRTGQRPWQSMLSLMSAIRSPIPQQPHRPICVASGSSRDEIWHPMALGSAVGRYILPVYKNSILCHVLSN